MSTFLVSYDLIGPTRDYDKVATHLKTYGRWARPLESVWLIETEKSAKEVRTGMSAATDANDKIIVMKLQTGIWSTQNIAASTLEWMHKYA